jgi:predicted enzyme related to lactoylglutathione lyase
MWHNQEERSMNTARIMTNKEAIHVLKSFEVICIPVKDQNVALAFYQGKLGMTVVNDVTMDDHMRWLQLSIGENPSTTISLVTWYESMKPGGLQGLVIGVDDIDATCQELRAAGVDVGRIDDTPWGRFAMFSDPDGNGLTLHQPNM